MKTSLIPAIKRGGPATSVSTETTLSCLYRLGAQNGTFTEIGVLRRRLWIVILAVVIAVGAAYLVSSRQTPAYEATSEVNIGRQRCHRGVPKVGQRLIYGWLAAGTRSGKYFCSVSIGKPTTLVTLPSTVSSGSPSS